MLFFLFLTFQDTGILNIPIQTSPLADALYKTGKQHRILVTYEDPLFPDDFLEYDVHNGQVTKTLIGKRVALELPYSVTDFRSAPKETLEKWVIAYETLIGRSFFDVVDSDMALHIIPKKSTDAEGNPILPVLALEVTFPYEERSVEDTLRLVTDQLASKTGRKVVPGTRPIGMMENIMTFLGADHEPARSVLYRMLIDHRLVWYLLEEPRGKWVVVNITYIPEIE